MFALYVLILKILGILIYVSGFEIVVLYHSHFSFSLTFITWFSLFLSFNIPMWYVNGNPLTLWLIIWFGRAFAACHWGNMDMVLWSSLHARVIIDIKTHSDVCIACVRARSPHLPVCSFAWAKHTNRHCRCHRRPHSCSRPRQFLMHFLHNNSLGCVLLVVYGAQIMWETMSKYRSFIFLMGILLITAGTSKTLLRNRDWYSRENLLKAGLRVLPHNAKMHYNFGNFMKDSFQYETARIHYQEALRFV